MCLVVDPHPFNYQKYGNENPINTKTCITYLSNLIERSILMIESIQRAYFRQVTAQILSTVALQR